MTDAAKKEPKMKGKSEAYYLETHADTGLVEGSLIQVEHDEIDSMLGETLPCGHEIDESDLVEFKRIVPKGEKRLMQRECLETGDLFFLATSDIHQCRFSPTVRAEKAKEKSKARRSEKRKAEKAELKALRRENATLKGEDADEVEVEADEAVA